MNAGSSEVGSAITLFQNTLNSPKYKSIKSYFSLYKDSKSAEEHSRKEQAYTSGKVSTMYIANYDYTDTDENQGGKVDSLIDTLVSDLNAKFKNGGKFNRDGEWNAGFIELTK